MFVKTIILMRKNFLYRLLSIVAVTVIIFVTSCKRTEIPVTPDTIPTNPTGGVVNDAAQVTASVSGIVLDETNAPVSGAFVTSGTANTTTNINGMFILKNISLSKENGSISVVKVGYFRGTRSFKTTVGKDHNIRLQLMAKTLSGTVNAAGGGTITSNGGATILFPANAFVTSTGAAYTGTVSVYSRWIDPAAANLPFIIPGDLRGVNSTGVENILETYGMVGAELSDASGNVLKIATGKTATVSFPIPASLSATAPASIVLWHFDDATARWKENGTATKNGSTYTAQVDKFSFWNADVPNTNFINLDYTLINATTNTPLVSTSTRIKRVSNGTYGYGITNNAGFVSGLVPKNEVLVLEVIASGTCGTVLYTQNIGPFAVSSSLGNISVTLSAAQTINFTGTILNCAGLPVINGYIALMGTSGGFGGFAVTNASGNFSFSVANCSGTNFNYNYQVIDNTTSQQSTILTGSATNSGVVNLGNISACASSASADVYVSGETGSKIAMWKNGVLTVLGTRTDSVSVGSIYVSGSDVYVAGTEGRLAKYWKNGVSITLNDLGAFIAEASSVFVSGNDVYVAGSRNYKPTYWKNGNFTTLSDDGFADAIQVVGNDVYVAGSSFSGSSAGRRARVWKNGIPLLYMQGDSTIGHYANSIFVDGNNIYAGGYQTNYITNSSGGSTGTNNVARYWKNGVPVLLSYSPSTESICTSIFVSGNDIYTTGYGTRAVNTNAPHYWKNGIPVELSLSSSVGRTTTAFVLNNNVYVGGYINNGGLTTGGAIWKNGQLLNQIIGTNAGIVIPHSIFVK
jgi:hypothetical protein